MTYATGVSQQCLRIWPSNLLLTVIKQTKSHWDQSRRFVSVIEEQRKSCNFCEMNMILIKCFLVEISVRPEVTPRTRGKSQGSNYED